jgi:DNA-binding SARP family transcriptional activator
MRLVLMGGLTLYVGGEATTGATTQRRRLALLALLAIARDRGLSRDKIQAYFWPESDSEHARHGLNQLLYFQRHRLAVGDLFLGKKTPRLNPAMTTCDVWEFEDALGAGAHEEAVRLYTGPFLDGFFLKRAPAFERWVDDQRSRLAKRCAGAIGALATAAAAKGDYHQAVEWWCRAAELNPFDTETVLRLIEASVAIGDRAAAVRHGQYHMNLLQTELGLTPDPRVMGMIDQLRHS